MLGLTVPDSHLVVLEGQLLIHIEASFIFRVGFVELIGGKLAEQGAAGVEDLLLFQQDSKVQSCKTVAGS